VRELFFGLTEQVAKVEETLETISRDEAPKKCDEDIGP